MIVDVLTDDNHIFLIGEESQITSLDPTSNKLTTFTQNNHTLGRDYCSTLLVEDTIYIMRKRSNHCVSQTTLVFDIATHSWDQIPPLLQLSLT